MYVLVYFHYTDGFGLRNKFVYINIIRVPSKKQQTRKIYEYDLSQFCILYFNVKIHLVPLQGNLFLS
jgi:hypothetical protein